MKTNKKVVLGFAVAMIFSLAFMQGNSIKSNKQDVNVQKISAGAGYMAGATEGGASGAWTAVSAMAGGIAVNTTSTLITATIGSAGTVNATPVGWGLIGTAVVTGL